MLGSQYKKSTQEIRIFSRAIIEQWYLVQTFSADYTGTDGKYHFVHTLVYTVMHVARNSVRSMRYGNAGCIKNLCSKGREKYLTQTSTPVLSHNAVFEVSRQDVVSLGGKV